MTTSTADIVICGAGIAGVAAAYHLVVRRGLRDIVLVESNTPLSMTSDKSMECYRNWYPGPGTDMVALVNRSIDLMEELEAETHGRFNMNRRGYAFATARADEASRLADEAHEEQRLGAGPLRIHDGSSGPDYVPSAASGVDTTLDGSDLLLDPDLISKHFPNLTRDTVAVLHTRRCGWLSAHQYGMYMLEQAREHGVKLLRGDISSVRTRGGRIMGVDVCTSGTVQRIDCERFVSAAGPLHNHLATLLGIELPLSCELHLKAMFADPRGVIPRQAPMLIWMDPGPLRWHEHEREVLIGSEQTRYLLDDFPAGVHGRPEGRGDRVILQWTHDVTPVEPEFPIRIDPHFADMLLHGMAVAMPGLEAYFDNPPTPYVDGGYYCKTPENRPLAGPLPVEGAFIIGGLSGFGMQSSSALGELLSLHVAGEPVPEYAEAFLLERYQNPDYVTAVAAVDPRLGQI